MSNNQHKRGDTFHYVGMLPVWFDLSVVEKAECQIRTAGGVFITDIETTIDRVNKTIALRKQVTDKWPIGGVQFDIQFTLTNGDIVSTSTVDLRIVRDITQ